MNTKIIVVCNQKGGSGKTSLSMLVGGTLALRKHKTLIVDADPQGTATRWAASAEDEAPFPAAIAGLSAAGSKLHREVKKFVGEYEFIVIDCPPAVDSPVPQSALMVSDLALIPIVPSPPDLWAGRGIKALVDNVSSINETLLARLVANMVQTQTTLGKDSLDILNDFGIPLANSKLGLRSVYREAALYGSTVHVFGAKAGKAIAEVDALTDEVLQILGDNPE